MEQPNQNPTLPAYSINRATIYVAIIFFIVGIGAWCYSGVTLKDVYDRIDIFLNSQRIVAVGVIILIAVAVAHAILHSIKRKVELSDTKSTIFDIHTWFTSTFLAIGTGFTIYTSLKVFNGLLGEKVANVQFLCNTADSLVFWPFMAISIIAIIYCIIRIGSMAAEIIELCKKYMK